MYNFVYQMQVVVFIVISLRVATADAHSNFQLQIDSSEKHLTLFKFIQSSIRILHNLLSQTVTQTADHLSIANTLNYLFDSSIDNSSHQSIDLRYYLSINHLYTDHPSKLTMSIDFKKYSLFKCLNRLQQSPSK